MSTSKETPRSGTLLNMALVVFGVAVVVLLYALGARMLSSRTDPLREENPAALVGDIIQVEVRNGCGVSSLAAEATRYLRHRGFDVVDVGDHTSFDVAQSMVIDRVGNLAAARKVARAMGIPEDRVVQDLKPEYYLDASIIIGKDYRSLTPFREAE